MSDVHLVEPLELTDRPQRWGGDAGKVPHAHKRAMALRQLVGRGVHIGAQWTCPKKPSSLNQVDILCPISLVHK